MAQEACAFGIADFVQTMLNPVLAFTTFIFAVFWYTTFGLLLRLPLPVMNFMRATIPLWTALLAWPILGLSGNWAQLGAGAMFLAAAVIASWGKNGNKSVSPRIEGKSEAFAPARAAEVPHGRFSAAERQAMARRLKPLGGSPPVYDAVVIGLGIAGAGIAWELTLRGLNVIGVEQGDFAQGTSSRSTSIIHAGIRYLELAGDAFLRGHFKEAWRHARLVWVAARERDRWEIMAPDLVKPQSIYIPSFRGAKGFWKIIIGVLIYCVFAKRWPRVSDIDFDPKKVKAKFPFLKADNLRGGFYIHDDVTDDALLTRRFVRGAFYRGATVLNFMKVEGCVRKGDYYEVTLLDQSRSSDGQPITVRARKVINATGPHINLTRELLNTESGSARIAHNFLTLSRGQ
jgi:hypothetical protein